MARPSGPWVCGPAERRQLNYLHQHFLWNLVIVLSVTRKSLKSPHIMCMGAEQPCLGKDRKWQDILDPRRPRDSQQEVFMNL